MFTVSQTRVTQVQDKCCTRISVCAAAKQKCKSCEKNTLKPVLISNGKREIVCGFFTSRATHDSEIIILHTFGFWQSLFIYISFEKPSMSGCWDSSLICTRQSRGISGTWLKPYGFSKKKNTHTHKIKLKKNLKVFWTRTRFWKGICENAWLLISMLLKIQFDKNSICKPAPWRL